MGRWAAGPLGCWLAGSLACHAWEGESVQEKIASLEMGSAGYGQGTLTIELLEQTAGSKSNSQCSAWSYIYHSATEVRTSRLTSASKGGIRLVGHGRVHLASGIRHQLGPDTERQEERAYPLFRVHEPR